MKIYVTEEGKPSEGEWRTRDAILIFPKNINGEVRWMEWAMWSEKWENGRWVAQNWR